MSAVGDALIERIEATMAARGIEYSPEAWDAITDELLAGPTMTPLEAATIALDHPDRQRLMRGYRARRVERNVGGVIEADHARADAWLVAEVTQLTA